MSQAIVHYLFNSGFAVQTASRLLIIDYYNLSPFKRGRGLDAGVVSEEVLCDRPVTVLASHAHMDHFVPEILKWERKFPNVQYVLSHDIDIGATARVTRVYPDQTYELDDMTVHTLNSTDEGVAFIIETDGLKIYHAGDLNWWHWEGEPADENEEMGSAYRREIDKLRGESFDLAFVPVDPRLNKQYLWGLDYFMKTADAKAIFPIHFRNAYSVFDRLMSDPSTINYRDRIVRISRRGERFELPVG